MKNFIKSKKNQTLNNKNIQSKPLVKKPTAQQSSNPNTYVPNYKQMGYDFSSLDNMVIDNDELPQHVRQGILKNQTEMFEPLPSKDEPNDTVPNQSEIQVENNYDISDLYASLVESDYDSYIVLIDQTPLYSGSKDDIEDVVSSLLFGEHEICGGEPIDLTRVLVLKKISMRVGALLGE